MGRNTVVRSGRHLVVVIGVAAIVLLGWQLARSHDQPRTVASPRANTVPSAPDPVVWHDVAGVRVPQSRLSGPRCVDGPLASCFTETDQGAAFAAANILVRTFPYAGPKIFGPVISRQVVGTNQPDMARLTKDAYLSAARTAGVRHGAPLRTDDGQVSGYRIIDPFDGPQDGQRNVGVLVAQSSPELDGAFVEYVVHLSWVGDDWLVTAPPWGDWRLAARDVGNPQSEDWQPFDKAVQR